MLQHQIASFGFHLFRQRRTADIIEVQLLAVLRLEQPLQAVQVVSVLLLLCGIQPQLVQNLIFNVSTLVADASFCLAQYCKIPAALFILSALSDWHLC